MTAQGAVLPSLSASGVDEVGRVPSRAWSFAADLNESRKVWASIGAASNLCNAIIGAGLLTLPYAFSRVGMGLGFALMVVFAIQTVFVCNILRACCAYTHEVTYSGLGRAFFGRRLEVAIDCLLGVYAFASCIGYLTILGDEMSTIFALLQEHSTFLLTWSWMGGRSLLLTVLTTVGILPLCLLRSVKSLQYAALLAVSSAFYIAVVVFMQMPPLSDTCVLAKSSMYTCDANKCVIEPSPLKAQYRNESSCAMECEGSSGLPEAEPIWANVGSGLWQSLPLFIYAFNCVVPFVPILAEMKRTRRTPKRIQTTLSLAVLSCLIGYCMCAFGGYLAFCDRSCPNILGCYPANNALILPARIALLINLIFIVPLFSFIVRSCVEKQMGLVSDAPGADVTESTNPWLSVLVTLCIVFSATALACICENLGVVLGLTGAVGGSILAWILPGLFVLQLLKTGGGRAALQGAPETHGSPTLGGSSLQLGTIGDGPSNQDTLVEQRSFVNHREDARQRFGAYVLIVLGVVLLCMGTALTIFAS